MQMPLPQLTGCANGALNRSPPSCIEDYRLAFKRLSIVTMPSRIRLDVWRFVSVVKAIDRAALVAVQPRAVTAKCDQISECYIGVIPHTSQLLMAIK